jgi:hypothetical protein
MKQQIGNILFNATVKSEDPNDTIGKLLALFKEASSHPTDEHIKTFAERNALKYAYANEDKYNEVVDIITYGAKFARKQILEKVGL